ncbi:hypothetical protein RUM44_004759 [Polyplax serrata]|uniref:DNA repair and recombination protein RAD54-like n=1 Tax=Polyplax serrata TaxID=468196 RepID=A0ABR1B3Q1_POLSC
MRRSQAPSLKTKSTDLNAEDSVTDYRITSCFSVSNVESKRSTESVLSLFDSCDTSTYFEGDVFREETKSLHGSTDLNNCIPKLNVEEHICTITKSNRLETDTSKIDQEVDSCPKIFNVVYGKQTKKKHKTWEGDGTLEVGSKFMTLKDSGGKVIGRAPFSKARKLEEGQRMYLGSKEIELLDLADIGGANIGNENEKSSMELNEQKNEPFKGRKPKISCKRFLSPRSCYALGITLPEPNTEHQWHYNQNNLPVTPVCIEETLSKKLRPHQCEGIKFLYESIMGFKDVKQTGAILADEMGLGKTLQCITLIWTVLKQGPYGNIPLVKKVLVVAPSSLTMNWYNEFIKWLGRAKLVPYVVTPKNKPSSLRGPVMIISYEMLVRYISEVEAHKFDLLVCDEGHRLKNSNIKTTQLLNRLNCPRRIILTGTPLQNDLNEFYTLVDFVNPNVLGTPAEFRSQFAEAIVSSRQPNADECLIKKGKECAQNLKKITSKFLLRRTRDILKGYLPPRHDIVVFCKITPGQRSLYNSSIDSFFDGINSGVCDGSTYLELITTLKKICNHPSLLKKQLGDEIPDAEVSGKVAVVVSFLQEIQMHSPKEKVVVVSNSTQTLNLLERVFQVYDYPTCRLDGSTPTLERNRLVERFNYSYSNAFVFLLSSKAGGVGLNVTGASRLILFDSDWNPATDLQAVSRIWRDGQKHPVYIYRLLTTGTIEEKIYQRQLSKIGLCDGTVDPENNKSIKISKEELKDLFFPCECDLQDCLTHDALSCECSKEGEIPIPEVEEEERSCQLVKLSKSSLKISELFHWEHHGQPFNLSFLSMLCLSQVQERISFIFYN